jgi:hypothetical protein
MLAIDPQNVLAAYVGTSGGVFKLEPPDTERKFDVPAGGAASLSTAETNALVQSGYATASIDSGPVPSGIEADIQRCAVMIRSLRGSRFVGSFAR